MVERGLREVAAAVRWKGFAVEKKTIFLKDPIARLFSEERMEDAMVFSWVHESNDSLSREKITRK